MTIEALTLPTPYVISGVGPYQIPFPYGAGTVEALIDLDGVLTPLDDLTLDPVSTETAGDLYLSPEVAAANAGAMLWLRRATTPEQGWVGAAPREKGLERQLDHLTMALQEQAAGAVRVLGAAQLVIPAANRALIWNGDATKLVAGPTASEIAGAAGHAATATAAAAAAALSAGAAETAATLLQGFVASEPFSGVTQYGVTDYALPYAPPEIGFVRLFLGGIPQQPGVDFVLVDMGGDVTGIRLQTPLNMDGMPFWGYLQQPEFVTGLKPYGSRTEALLAAIPPSSTTLAYYTSGGILRYLRRDPTGTAMIRTDGSKWSPCSDATPEDWSDVPNYLSMSQAMQWSIDNSRRFVARGSYTMADGFTLYLRGKLMFDLIGATFVAEKNTYPTTRLDMIRVQSGGDGSADWTLDWDGGKFDATWMPFPGAGASRYLVNISNNAAAFVRRFRVEGLIAGKTFMHKPLDDLGRVCGGESGIFFASPNGHIEVQRAIGFKDAVVYISSPSGLSSGRYGMVTYDVRAEYCRHCVTAKRGYYQFSGRLQAYQCREGVGFSQATMEGPYQSGWGGIHFVDARCCEWAVCDREGQKATYHFNSIDIGVMFGESSPGAGDGFKSTEACGIRFLGSTDLTSYGSVHGVNPDIVADGYTLGNFRAVVFKDSGSGKSATNNTVHLTASNVDRLVVDLESGDGTPDPDRNLIVHRSHDIALGSVILGANTILTTHRRWSDLGSITADTLTLNTALTGAAVMANKTDLTPNLVMLNGAHGLAILRDVNNTHDVKTIAPGFVGNATSSSVPAGAPVDGAYRWIGQKHEKDSNTASLIWHRPDGNMLYIQSNSGGVWSDWSRLYGWNNILGAVSLSGGVPTGRLIEYGSYASGRYVRLTDGTQICWQTVTVNLAISTAFLGGFRSTGQTWTFPAAFSAAPVLSGSSPDQTTLPPVFGTTGATSSNWNAVAFTSQSAADRTVTLMAIGRWV